MKLTDEFKEQCEKYFPGDDNILECLKTEDLNKLGAQIGKTLKTKKFISQQLEIEILGIFQLYLKLQLIIKLG